MLDEVAKGPTITTERELQTVLAEVVVSSALRAMDIAAAAPAHTWADVQDSLRGTPVRWAAAHHGEVMSGFSIYDVARSSTYPEDEEDGGVVTWDEFFVNLDGTWGMMNTLPSTSGGRVLGGLVGGAAAAAWTAVAISGLAGTFTTVSVTVAGWVAAALALAGVPAGTTLAVATLVGIIAGALVTTFLVVLAVVVGVAIVWWVFNLFGNTFDETALGQWLTGLIDRATEGANNFLNKLLPGREERKEERREKWEKRKEEREAKENERDDIFAAPGWPDDSDYLLGMGFLQNAFVYRAYDVAGSPMYVAVWR